MEGVGAEAEEEDPSPIWKKGRNPFQLQWSLYPSIEKTVKERLPNWVALSVMRLCVLCVESVHRTTSLSSPLRSSLVVSLSVGT